MTTRHTDISVSTSGRKLYDITRSVDEIVRTCGVRDGLCHLFVKHTSCAVLLSENADPSVRRDLMYFIQKLVPDDDPNYIHTCEGADDMPAHIKSALLPVSLAIPIRNGSLELGTWQAIYLWEHRTQPHNRRIVVSVLG